MISYAMPTLRGRRSAASKPFAGGGDVVVLLMTVSMVFIALFAHRCRHHRVTRGSATAIFTDPLPFMVAGEPPRCSTGCAEVAGVSVPGRAGSSTSRASSVGNRV